MKHKYNITIIGLGYVGLPLAVEFAKKYKTYGIDINKDRIEEIRRYNDSTLEIDSSDLKEVVVTDNDKFNKINNGLFLSTSINENMLSDI